MLKRTHERVSETNGPGRNDPPRAAARLSRRVAMAGVVALPFAAEAANDGRTGDGLRGNTTSRTVAELVRRTEQAAKELIRGDINAYLELIRHADDYTLMQPFVMPPRTIRLNPHPKATLTEDLPCEERDSQHIVTHERG